MKGYVVGTIVGLVALTSSISHGCGGSFPNTYFIEGDEAKILDLPYPKFHYDLLRMFPELSVKPTYQDKWNNWWCYDNTFSDNRLERNIQNDFSPTWEKTLLMDIGDLQASLQANGKSQAECDRIISAYRAMRETIKAENPPRRYYTSFPSPLYERLQPFDLTPYESVLNEIGREFALYARGAAAYRTNDFQEAERYWNELLQLPEAERHYRSTWASFMLGKIALIDNATKAIDRFETTRDLVARGFSDSINSATASIGWQAKAERATGKYREAIVHYWYLLDAGYDTHGQFLSLKSVYRKMMTSNDPIPAECVTDPLCRKITTAWVRSFRLNDNGLISKRWLNAIRNANVALDPGELDMLAWSAYQKGDIEDARHWLALNPSLGPDGKWIQSKLLLREGKIDEAMEILHSLVGMFDVTDGDNVMSELALLCMGRQQFVEAMDLFLRSSYWPDAAYVAERILTLDELGAYIKEQNKITSKNNGQVQCPFWNLLNHLYARRLARANQWEKAIPHFSQAAVAIDRSQKKAPVWGYTIPQFSSNITSIAQDFTNHYKASRDKKISKHECANHLFEAAVILYTCGFELIGSEHEPDTMFYEGDINPTRGATYNRLSPNFDPKLPTDAQAIKPFLLPSSAEIERASESIIIPFEHYHYRYVAADLMWECAKMLPNNDPLTAKALYYGGTFIALRDAAKADRFYKALVKRCRHLPLGKQADETRWFPKNVEFDVPKKDS